MAIGRVKTKVEKSGEIVAYSEIAVRNNASVVEYCRTSMAALSGGTAGLLGLTGFYGFGFYVFAVVGLWALILLKAGYNWKKYFISRRMLLTNGFFGSLFTYVLFWTYFSASCTEWFMCTKTYTGDLKHLMHITGWKEAKSKKTVEEVPYL